MKCAAVTAILAAACVEARDDPPTSVDDASTISKCTPEWCLRKQVPWAGHDLQGVWTGGEGEVWVTDRFGRMHHHDASVWSVNEHLDWFGGAAVWGATTTDVWAVSNTVRHWDGSSWTTTPTSDLVTGATWECIWGFASDDVWIAGGGGILQHWDGEAWTSFGRSRASISLPYTYTMLGMWGSSPSDMWIVGNFGYSHWDGRAVSYPVRTLSQNASGIWGFARNDIWVVGQFGLIGHFDGSVWSEVKSPTSKHLHGIWGSAPNDIWAVGDAGTILHWDGTHWSESPSGVEEPLFGVWGTGTGEVWATGSNVILHHARRNVVIQ